MGSSSARFVLDHFLSGPAIYNLLKFEAAYHLMTYLLTVIFFFRGPKFSFGKSTEYNPWGFFFRTMKEKGLQKDLKRHTDK
jgi:hypothetical protein